MRKHKLGKEVAGVKILKWLDEEEGSLKSRYWVKYLCCGAEGEITHSGIKSRKRKNSRFCRACYDHGERLQEKFRTERRKQDYGIIAGWPVPPSIVKG